ncbi:MAG: T9SS C-terminal target domain-containing protein, partial [Chitinophagia bacterium]|nr:T9SS C-terminal target domain-containing protein [Chitinophagia bacterium]
WVKIQGSFIARGHEKFITIGVFADTGNVIHISPSGGGYYGLYVVDDVSVLPADARADAGRDTTIRHPGDTARIGVPGSDGIPAYWYQLGSSTAIDSGGSIKVHPMVTTSYVVRLDLCGASTFDTVKVSVDTSRMDVHTILNTEKLALYPNPAREVLTISGGHGCTFTLCNLMGQEVIRTPLTRPLQDVPLLGIPPGVYLVYITDGVGNRHVQLLMVNE